MENYSVVDVSLWEGGFPFGVNVLRNMNLFSTACCAAIPDMLSPWDPLAPLTCGLPGFGGPGGS